MAYGETVERAGQAESARRMAKIKRILFVDDDPEVFEGLQRLLKADKRRWEISFAPEGQAALALLAATPSDVVLSDLRMPGMDGAALLGTVRQRRPGIVRIILSGKAEMDDALRAVPVAHQCLLKPCDPATLWSAIERATSLSEVLNSKLLAGIVGSVQDLPGDAASVPRTTQRTGESGLLAEESGADRRAGCGCFGKDSAAGELAFFGLPRNVSSVQMAVSYIGAATLQNLVLPAEVFHVFEKCRGVKGFSFEDLHMHSQLTARIAARLLPDSPARDAAVIAGLLHDVGKLILATRSPQHFARAIEGSRVEKKPLYAVEQTLMGVSHAEVGAYLLGLWGLPSAVVEAVAHHHAPGRFRAGRSMR